MNKVILIGRLTADPDVRITAGENPMQIARYTLAVDRRFKKDGDQADFIRCVAFGKAAEFAEKYMYKGKKYCIAGRIQTGSYTDRETGKKVYTTDIVVEEQEFVEPKGDSRQQGDSQQGSDIGDGFMSIPDGVDEDLPWN